MADSSVGNSTPGQPEYWDENAWGPWGWWCHGRGSTQPRKGRVRGRPLRYLLTMALRDAGRPLTVSELVTHCENIGVVFEGRASKIVSDSLRWEIAWGRVRRLGRGVYRYGRIPRTTLRFITDRLGQMLRYLRPRPSPGPATGPALFSIPGTTALPGGGLVPGVPAVVPVVVPVVWSG